ncbi:MAG: Lar family restriction alleviation protein [Christensenellaceae bacterium]|nr:Lar family restriction alleviation protein [Christensenellaceae bacterium]
MKDSIGKQLKECYGNPITGLKVYCSVQEEHLPVAFCVGFGIQIAPWECAVLEFGNKRLYLHVKGLSLDDEVGCDMQEVISGDVAKAAQFLQGRRVKEISGAADSFSILFEDGLVIEAETDEDSFLTLDLQKPFFLPQKLPEGMELCACSVCGGTGVLGIDQEGDFSVECKNCENSTRAFMNREKAVDAWNCR